MTTSLRTPTKTTRGLGSAKEGAGHFIQQRVSAIALAILVPWFLIALMSSVDAGYADARAFVAHPVNAVLLILAVTAAFYHMRLGVQVVIEDYIAAHGSRTALLILNLFAALLLWVAAVFAILKIALGA